MLTIKELAPYLPYRLKGKSNQYDSIDLLLGIYGTMGHSLTLCHRINNHNTCDYDCNVNEFKPILRPLSDLIKEIEVNGKKFVPAYRTQVHINDKYLPFTVNGRIVLENRIVTNTILYTDMQYLISLHFDVFGLIEKDLAIDINKLVK
jgi:hypothetical protein